MIESLFGPDVPETSHWESKYAARDVPAGAVVTRFAPSPTGFLHTGGVYAATIAKNLARHSGGVYFVRIEDTDQARDLAEAREQFAKGFEYFSMQPDEDDETAQWGPYEQSKRSLIYQSFARELLRRDRAYLCFCTRDELAEMAERQQKAKVTTGYYGEWARCRHLQADEVRRRVDNNQPYTIRFRSPDGDPTRVVFEDLIRGPMEQPDNRNDIVLLKSSDQSLRLPTYHFAHVVDDHLMRVTLVLRGEEWISSVPVHLQLFEALGFAAIPYAHIAPLMKMEGSSKRKLSKRKDPEANVEFYISAGYPAGAVLHYLRGLANSRIAEMSFDESAAAPIRLSECGVAGPMFDLVKLESVSREYISYMSIDDALNALMIWAEQYDASLAKVLQDDAAVARRILAMDREPGLTQRKDLAKWSDFQATYGLYFTSFFELVTDPADKRFAPIGADTVRTLLKDFAAAYRHLSDKDTWFEQIRAFAAAHSFAPSVGEFKKSPQLFAGTIRDVSNIIRVALTGSTQSPELFRVAQILGHEEVVRRVSAVS